MDTTCQMTKSNTAAQKIVLGTLSAFPQKKGDALIAVQEPMARQFQGSEMAQETLRSWEEKELKASSFWEIKSGGVE